ncbi:hypothetical protein GZH47_08975 [Paenibacillus rhizovicinus]|uniref:Uncharacterized protein n=1 Tax=Paenibacillus rhizovicinus TaxID=2704463 RepID=A0A6C0NXL8_9BACL|nr:hypothetical protein [Paenibacillus rhizovicinus]QHW30970.1 hypothetical protein GZH47_08975 [Paenibacillus rhizovicinus]
MSKRLAIISIIVLSLLAIPFFGYRYFEWRMTYHPIPKTHDVAKELHASNVKRLGVGFTDLLQTSPYYYVFQANKDGEIVLVIVDQNFGRSSNGLVKRSYVIIHPRTENKSETDGAIGHRIEVSDGQAKYESTAYKRIIINDNVPTNLIFVLKDGRKVDTFQWGLKMLKLY